MNPLSDQVLSGVDLFIHLVLADRTGNRRNGSRGQVLRMAQFPQLLVQLKQFVCSLEGKKIIPIIIEITQENILMSRPLISF